MEIIVNGLISSQCRCEVEPHAQWAPMCPLATPLQQGDPMLIIDRDQFSLEHEVHAKAPPKKDI